MKTKAIAGSDFWAEMRKESSGSPNSIAHFIDGEMHYIAVFGLKMVPIIRTGEELFSETVAREVKSQDLIVAINGNMWDATSLGIADAFAGQDPVPASETEVKGWVVSNGARKIGTSEPKRFFISYRGEPATPYSFTSSYSIGFGNPPLEKCGIGGLGPLIVGKLPFGPVNKYRSGVPAGAPVVGEPGPGFLPYLVQRSNAHFTDVANLNKRSGKVAFALNRQSDILLILIQPNDSKNGLTWEQLRDKLVSIGTDDAVFLDGSDSAMLVLEGHSLVNQDETKGELTTVGLGFKKK